MATSRLTWVREGLLRLKESFSKMQRRHFLRNMGYPVAGLALSACGGGDSDDIYPDEEGLTEGVVTEVGPETSFADNLPAPIRYELSYLLESSGEVLSANVFLGDAPVAATVVDFYDASGKLLASAVTDALGQCVTGLIAPRYVRALAHTNAGALEGFAHYFDLRTGSLEINLIQDLVIRVQAALGGSGYNVAAGVILPYFGLNQSQSLECMRPGNANFSLALMAADWKASQVSLAQFLQRFATDMIDHLEDESHVNTAYRPLSTGALQGPFNWSGKEQIAMARKFLETVIGKAVKLPYANEIFSFFWDRLVNDQIPEEETIDPLVEISNQLVELRNEIAALTTLVKELDLKDTWIRIAGHFDTFINAEKKAKNSLNDKASLQDLLNTYQKAIDSAGDLDTAARLFFGCDNYMDDQSLVFSLNRVLQDKKYFTRLSGEYYQRYLSLFVLQQTAACTLLTAAETAIGKFHNRSESVTAKRIGVHKNRCDLILEQVTALSIELLPERIFVDHQLSLAWVGACSAVEDWRRFIPTGVKVVSFNGGKIDYDGRGWGLSNRTYMKDLPDNATNEEVLVWGNWRLPLLEETKARLLSRANAAKKDIRDYASAQLVPESVPFHLAKVSRLATVVTDSSRKYLNRFSENFGAKVDVVSFAEKKVYSQRLLAYAYRDDKHVYAYFPVCDVDETKLTPHLPWLLFNAKHTGVCAALKTSHF